MKRIKFSFLGLLVSISLAFTSPVHAQFGNVSNAALDSNTSSAVSNEISQSAILNVVFDGWNLSWKHVTLHIAKDPIVAWGAVRDERGNWVQGEVWLIVAKKDKFIYFHLTDTPNSAKDSTSYNGYTVKVKASMTMQFYSFGFGGTVPLIGNDTDAFLMTTTEFLANSTFIEGETARLDFRTGAEIAYLVHLYDTVQSLGISSTGSRGSVAIQHFAPDGTEIGEPFSQSWHESASSGASNSDYCDTVADRMAYWTDPNTLVTAEGYGVVLLGGMLTGITGGTTIPFDFGLGMLIGATEDIRLDIHNGMNKLLDRIGVPAASALAEGACEAVLGGDDFPVLPPIELFDIDDIVFAAGAQIVCDRYESEPTGSSSRETNDGGVEVTGLSEMVCAEWHFEIIATVKTQ
jgi:hypothetical protein